MTGAHLAGGTLLGVHLALVDLLRPVAQQAVARLELLAGDRLVPGRVAEEAPEVAALFALDPAAAQWTRRGAEIVRLGFFIHVAVFLYMITS